MAARVRKWEGRARRWGGRAEPGMAVVWPGNARRAWTRHGPAMDLTKPSNTSRQVYRKVECFVSGYKTAVAGVEGPTPSSSTIPLLILLVAIVPVILTGLVFLLQGSRSIVYSFTALHLLHL